MNLSQSIFISFFCLFQLIYSKSITITWSTPKDLTTSPAPGTESLKAVLSHVQALLLAELVPRLPGIDKSLTIKLCPPQPYDPLVNHFVIQRIAAYSAIYDHDCINKVQQGMILNKISSSSSSPAWGFKPKPNPIQPQKPFPPPTDFYGSKGLTVPTFLIKLYKHSKSASTDPIADNSDPNPIWILDSKSLKNYLTAPILQSLHKKSQNSPAFQILNQINAMRSGSLEEKNKDQLAMVPLAVQESLVLVLPNYSEWATKNLPIKHLFFNPTWWSTRYIPRNKSQILKLIKLSIEKTRKSDQLIIIVHDPTPFNLDIMTQLTTTYGEKKLISSTRILPKATTTLQLLQFIQKAASVILDSRDLLGQVSLLSTGFPARIHQFQDFSPFTFTETIIYSVLGIWLFIIMIISIYYTDKLYDEKLHCHFKRLALFSLLALTPVYVLLPSMWPKYITMVIYSIFESGYGLIVYVILGFYILAICITFIILAVNYFRKKRASAIYFPDSEASEALISDSESLQLIPKQ